MDYWQRLQESAIVIAAFYTQYTTILTILPLQSTKAYWTDIKVIELIAYLYIHRSEGEQENFKMSMYAGAAAHIIDYLV